MKKFQIKHLNSGGLITNYNCTSRCAHCLYACSPSRSNEYMTGEMAAVLLHKAKQLGTDRMHIGGGEPFLNLHSLLVVLKEFRKAGVMLEYIETNSSWYTTEKECHEILSQLKNYGLNALLISISPFHNEFIPLNKVKKLIQACQKTGVQVFPWIIDFFAEMDKLDDEITHSLEELCHLYGDNYVKKIPSRYWMTMRGRAISSYRKYLPEFTVEQIIRENDSYCTELSDTTHFHLDLSGNYVPGLCAGLTVFYKDLGGQLAPCKYPFLNVLATEGIGSLYKMAKYNYGFIPFRYYISKCDLCQHIRQFFVIEKNIDSAELKPASFYKFI